MAFIDYHTHTNFSDGSDSPNELLKKASEKGISEIAITDHDNIDAITTDLINSSPVKLISGVELSADYGPGTMHIVGLNIDINNGDLKNKLQFLATERKNRTPKIVAKLKELNIDISEEEINKKAGSGSVSRNHIAALLLEKGYVKTRIEAFERYLKKGAPAYMDKVRLKPEECVKILKRSGALVILAHPVQLKLENNELRKVIKELIGYGLDGMEVKSTHHSKEQILYYSNIADEFDLIKSAGSDYHGAVKKNVNLGIEADRINFS